MLSSIFFGVLVSRFDNYTAPFVPIAVLLAIGTLLWLKIDATRQLIPEAFPLELARESTQSIS